MAEPGKIPIRDNVGAALRFVRQNWQFVAIVSAIAAVTQGVVLLGGPNLIWMLVVLAAITAAYTAFTRAALTGSRQLGNRQAADSLRVGAAMAMIGVLIGIIFVMLMFVTMSVLIAPYAEEVKAAGENEAAMRAIMERAMAAQPGVPFWAMAAGAVIMFLLTTRLYFAAPGSVDEGRIVVFESWRLTRGNFLRIAGARLLLLGPAFILAGALQTLAGNALGAPTSDPIALFAYGQNNPVGFALFYSVAIFLQLSLFSALEAGLSAYLYRSVKPPPAA
jgi:hypothetical protein